MRFWQIWVLIKRGTDDRAKSGMESEIRKILHQVNHLKCIDWTERFTLYDWFINKLFYHYNYGCFIFHIVVICTSMWHPIGVLSAPCWGVRCDNVISIVFWWLICTLYICCLLSKSSPREEFEWQSKRDSINIIHWTVSKFKIVHSKACIRDCKKTFINMFY